MAPSYMSEIITVSTNIHYSFGSVLHNDVVLKHKSKAKLWRVERCKIQKIFLCSIIILYLYSIILYLYSFFFGVAV